MTKKCEQLSKERKETASILQEKIKAALSDLNFAYVDFEISWSRKDTFGADGWDEAEFLIATNPASQRKASEKSHPAVSCPVLCWQLNRFLPKKTILRP